MARWKDTNWNLAGKDPPCDHAILAVLMDLRDELSQMKESLQVLGCPEFRAIPRKLERIARNTKRKRRQK